jgi:hypothetical protein
MQYKFRIKFPSNEHPWETVYETQYNNDEQAEKYAEALREQGYIVTILQD